ncbi:5-hydroxytryptamine receptor 3A-like [Lates calcarifer]|uniref:5-hydroxytryptamine receptor 3A-like n=1 Tax=Lates calcarifer TaxID=8187 RepID=A0AAJ8AY69_LATCA|nr:5-hydroxytryptamine receptor 3A-like [Lates calcarifer]
MLIGFFFLLLLTGGASSLGNCSYHAVLKHLDLTNNKELYTLTRPVNNYTSATSVNLDVRLYAILEIVKKDQKFVPYVWVTMWWKNDFIGWNRDDFCGIKSVSVPTELMWKPDVTIEEMTEKDKAPPAPYLTIHSSGYVELANDQVIVSTCRMHVYKFPFDTQTCNLTFKSVIHSIEEIKIVQHTNSSEATEDSRKVMQTQFEWLFVNMTVTNKIVKYYNINQSVVIYTVNMKRRSALYIVNFILPVLFFLGLDLASFLISDSGGEKLSFKVTVLLAVTVMQLILNEILPASSNRIPLIAVYCIGIFSLMMLSLLETILVMYLIEKDSASQDNETDRGQTLSEDCRDKREEVNKSIQGCNVSPGKMPSELLPVEEDSGSQLMEEAHTSKKFSDDLREALKSVTLLLNSRKEEEKPNAWTRKTKTINKVFVIFYMTAASLFLLCMFFNWIKDEQH